MKETDFSKDIEKLNKRNLLSSNELDKSIKNLSNPRFLGSIHLKKSTISTNFSSVENLLNGELELKINKALKNSIFNPITKIMVLSMIVFNLLWIFFLYIL
jgi:hypothetical protein